MPHLLASMEDFAAVRGATFDPTDLQALIALEGASGIVRSYCNREFTYVEDDVATVMSWGTAGLLVPEMPVYDVSAITVIAADGTENALVTSDWWLDGASGILYRTSTIGTTYPWYWGWSWYTPTSRVEVTYTHGYILPGEDAIDDVQDLPSEISLVVMSIGSRNITTTASGGQAVRSKQVGSYQVSYGDTSTAIDEYGMSAAERQVLDHYRIWATP